MTELINKLKKEFTKKPQLALVKNSKKSIWSPEEDDILARAVEKYKGKNWESIAKYFENKDLKQCQHRWRKVLNPVLKKGKWTQEEDGLLIKYVKKFGDSQWVRLASKIPNRNSKQCRERWKNQLDPKIKRTPWTVDEDRILIERHIEFGNKWSNLKQFLPGRSANNIKNRWNAGLKRKIHEPQYADIQKKVIPKRKKTNKIIKRKKTNKIMKSKKTTKTIKIKTKKKKKEKPISITKPKPRSRVIIKKIIIPKVRTFVVNSNAEASNIKKEFLQSQKIKTDSKKNAIIDNQTTQKIDNNQKSNLKQKEEKPKTHNNNTSSFTGFSRFIPESESESESESEPESEPESESESENGSESKQKSLLSIGSCSGNEIELDSSDNTASSFSNSEKFQKKKEKLTRKRKKKTNEKLNTYKKKKTNEKNYLQKKTKNSRFERNNKIQPNDKINNRKKIELDFLDINAKTPVNENSFFDYPRNSISSRNTILNHGVNAPNIRFLSFPANVGSPTFVKIDPNGLTVNKQMHESLVLRNDHVNTTQKINNNTNLKKIILINHDFFNQKSPKKLNFQKKTFLNSITAKKQENSKFPNLSQFPINNVLGKSEYSPDSQNQAQNTSQSLPILHNNTQLQNKSETFNTSNLTYSPVNKDKFK
ncbi:transcription repressor myb5 [Anaeramoeba flamelloides]|uniref:Transcription repressor myb5 n=1 Tax=Anaeramoeba flamelloides TaxID=1746091 RepID=A0ABQ8Z3J1_9EUKA|nr:transcription repressor myb5 [Anaeramoeba flamelloides]